MGANILNMGVLGGFVGFYSFKGLQAVFGNVRLAGFIAAWCACLIPALVAAVELYVAGTFPLVLGLAGMGLYHAAIGLIEGTITVVALHLIMDARPDLIPINGRVPA
jgi:cobalt/nickel transport system permease protein